MAIPIIGLSFIGGIVTAITAALGTRLGVILAGAGLTFIALKGLQTIIGFLVVDINLALGMVGSSMGSGTSTNFGYVALKMAAYAGLIDYINIIVSGMLTSMSVKGMRVLLSRLQS